MGAELPVLSVDKQHAIVHAKLPNIIAGPIREELPEFVPILNCVTVLTPTTIICGCGRYLIERRS